MQLLEMKFKLNSNLHTWKSSFYGNNEDILNSFVYLYPCTNIIMPTL